MWAAVYGYKCIFVLADKQSQEKIDLSKIKEHNVVQNRQANLTLKAAELASK